MTYDEIFAEVKMLCKRGDVDDKIAAAIRMTALRAHRTDFYWRDRVEAQLQWATQQTLVEINVLTWLPRFRAANYARYWDPINGALGLMLTQIDPRAVLDEYNYEKLDRYYMAGDVLKVRFEYPTRGVQIGYFVSPVVTPGPTFQSWIGVQFPDIIIQGALAYLYNQTGKQEEARMINRMVGFEEDPGRNMAKGPTLLEQLKQFALEEGAR